jgi:hypothetical protein
MEGEKDREWEGGKRGEGKEGSGGRWRRGGGEGGGRVFHLVWSIESPGRIIAETSHPEINNFSYREKSSDRKLIKIYLYLVFAWI